MVSIYNEDCLQAMRKVKDNTFDLAIVDPPYGIGEDGKSNHSRGDKATAKKYAIKEWDRHPPSVEYFEELMRVSRNQIIWGANHFISRIPFDSSCWIVWDKENGATHFADCELAWTSFKTAVRMFKFNWNGMWQGDMKNKEHRIHPTQKPVRLYKWLLHNYAIGPECRILDTHMGSGSSAIAAHDMGFDFVGYEIDRDYFYSAQDRINRHISQGRLFE